MPNAPGDPTPEAPPPAGRSRPWLKAIALFWLSFAVAWPIARWQLHTEPTPRVEGPEPFPETALTASRQNPSRAPRANATEAQPRTRAGGRSTSPSASIARTAGSAPSAESEPRAIAGGGVTDAPRDTTACLDSWSPGVFGTSNPLDWVCEQPDAWSLELDLHSRVRREGTGDGADVWLGLAHYEFAAIAVLRAKCCPGAAPLVAAVPTSRCPSLEDALATVGRDVSEESVNTYSEVLQCLIHRQIRMPASWHGVEEADARAAFETFLRYQARGR